MIRWEERPIEIANLFNPAFCGEVLRRSINSYQHTNSSPFPYPLTFLVLPIVLHRDTRERISSHQRLTLHAWLQRYPDLKIGFAERASELIPITKEAIIFLLQVDAVRFDEQAGLISQPYKSVSITGQDKGEIADCYRKAEIARRLFARAGTVTTVYAMWGVRP